MKLDLFHQSLNKLNDPNRFQDWKTHRDTISKFLTEIFEQTSEAHVLVVGSGNCDDLDVCLIQQQAKCVTFIDIDDEATQRALELRCPELLEKSKIIKMDVLGFIEEFEELKYLLDNGNEKAILRKFRTIYARKLLHPMPLIDEKFDVAIVLPIYTQLIGPYLLGGFDGSFDALKHPIHKINTEIAYLANASSRFVQSRIFNNIRLGAYMFSISDLYNVLDPGHAKYFNSINNIRSGDEMYARIMQAATEAGVNSGVLGYVNWFKENEACCKQIVKAAWIWNFEFFKRYGILSHTIQKISSDA